MSKVDANKIAKTQRPKYMEKERENSRLKEKQYV